MTTPDPPRPPLRAPVLARRLVLPLLLGLAGGLVAGAILGRILDGAVAGRTKETAFSLLERVGPDVEAVLATGGDPKETVDRIGRQLALRATLVATDGRVLGDSGVDRSRLDALENHAGRPEVRDALRSGRGVEARFSSTLGQRLVYAAARLRSGEVLRLAFPEKDLTAWEAPYRRRVLLVCVAAGLLAGALFVRLRLRQAAELGHVLRAVEAVARGRRPANPGAVLEETAAVHSALADLLEQTSERNEAVLRQETVSRAIFEGIPTGLLVVDRELSLLDANSAALGLLRLPAGALRRGEHVLELVREKAVTDLLREALDGGRAAGPLRLATGSGDLELRAEAIRVSGEGAAGRPAAVAILREAASPRPS
ncbi:MAG TPA: PAS domain-containing protein [Thermoanaerobaculia bacterium]|nr:PAS domain-containing protein [Thermoanaerobaculia bacterium]